MLKYGDKDLRKRWMGTTNISTIHLGTTNIWPYITNTSVGSWVLTVTPSKTSISAAGETITITVTGRRTTTYTWVNFVGTTTTRYTTTADETLTEYTINSSIGTVSGNEVTIPANPNSSTRSITVTVTAPDGTTKTVTLTQASGRPVSTSVAFLNMNKNPISTYNIESAEVNSEFVQIGYIAVYFNGSLRSDVTWNDFGIKNTGGVNSSKEAVYLTTYVSYSGTKYPVCTLKVGQKDSSNLFPLYAQATYDESYRGRYEPHAGVILSATNGTYIQGFVDVTEPITYTEEQIGEYSDLAAGFTTNTPLSPLGWKRTYSDNTIEYYYVTDATPTQGSVSVGSNGNVVWSGNANSATGNVLIRIEGKCGSRIGYWEFTHLISNATEAKWTVRRQLGKIIVQGSELTDIQGIFINVTITYADSDETVNVTVPLNRGESYKEVAYEDPSGLTYQGHNATVYPTHGALYNYGIDIAV